MASSLDNLKSFLGTTSGKAVAFGTGALALGGIAVAGVSAVRSRSKSRRKKAKKKTSKRKTTSKKRKSKPKYARTAGKAKDRSTRRIRMTKNGQPYVILKSGKARFISKKSAAQSRKRKGGRY